MVHVREKGRQTRRTRWILQRRLGMNSYPQPKRGEMGAVVSRPRFGCLEGPTGAYWSLLEPTGAYWSLLEPAGACWGLLMISVSIWLPASSVLSACYCLEEPRVA